MRLLKSFKRDKKLKQVFFHCFFSITIYEFILFWLGNFPGYYLNIFLSNKKFDNGYSRVS